MGDAVDNIPGIAGVGEKTAAKLLAEYGTLEKVLENADNIKGALGEKIRNGKDAGHHEQETGTIITNVPCEFHEENFRIKEIDKEVLKEVFAELEFKAIGKRIFGDEFNPFTAAGALPAQPVAVQTDLFGNIIETPAPGIKIKQENDATAPGEGGSDCAARSRKKYSQHTT